MKNYLFLLVLIFPFFAFSQEIPDAVKYKTREVGLNATPFVSTFISIGETSLRNQVATITWKNINAKNNAFRIGIGIKLDDFDDGNSVHFRIGFEKRRLIKKNWWYYWGGDLLLNVDDDFFVDNNPAFGTGFGIGPVFGLFYNFNDRISLSTESSLYLIVGDGTSFNFVPPISLFFNVRFKKMKRRYRYMERY